MATEVKATALGSFFEKSKGMAFGLVLGAVLSPSVSEALFDQVKLEKPVAPAIYYDEANGYVGAVPTAYYEAKEEWEFLSKMTEDLVRANNDMSDMTDQMLQLWDEIDSMLETTEGKITAKEQISLISEMARERVVEIANNFRKPEPEKQLEDYRTIADTVMSRKEVEDLGKKYNFNGVAGYSHPEFKQDEKFDPTLDYQKETAALVRLTENLKAHVLEVTRDENAILADGIEKMVSALNQFLDASQSEDFDMNEVVAALDAYSVAVIEVASGPVEETDEVAELINELEATDVSPM